MGFSDGEMKLGITERKGRERAEREQRIVAVARLIAEREGWDAVTIRRLANEIEYSKPVLYSHFESREAIIAAVALVGFQEITVALREAASEASSRNALKKVATAYLAFASSRPALYEAMFMLPTQLRFAAADTRPELRAAFEALAAVIGPFCNNVDAATETFWATLHGLAQLERTHRIKASTHDERVRLVVRAIVNYAKGSQRRTTPVP